MKKTVLLKILCAVLAVSLCAFGFAACSSEDKGEENGSQVTVNGEITG